ncbi:hypothetical protein BLOT_013052 [Blomia tropicalis]|nr:hypothetical protein BLOT_013052 [Blomia tropicalis]
MPSQIRRQVVDFTHSIYTEQLVFFTLEPTIKKNDFLIPHNIATIVYLFNVISLIAYICTIYLISRFWVSTKLISKNLSFMTISVRILALVVRQSDDSIFHEKTISIRILYSILLLSMLIMTTEYDKAIDTIDDLLTVVEDDTFKICVLPKSAINMVLINAEPDARVYYTLAQNIVRNNAIELYPKYKNDVRLVENEKNIAFISSRTSILISRYIYATKPIHIGSEPLSLYHLAWALPKGSPLKEPFNLVIKRLIQSGIPDRWIENIIYHRSNKIKVSSIYMDPGFKDTNNAYKKDETVKILTINELESLFSFCIFGNLVACFSFIIEIIFNRTRKWLCNSVRVQYCQSSI